MIFLEPLLVYESLFLFRIILKMRVKGRIETITSIRVRIYLIIKHALRDKETFITDYKVRDT